MKKIKNTNSLRSKLQLNQETVKLLTDPRLENVRGGAQHTSFSCGRDLCTTH